MRINRRIGAAVGALALIGAAGATLAVTAGAAAPPAIDVSADHVTCTTFFGSFKLTQPIQLAPSPVVSTTATLKGTLDGCVDADNSNVHLVASKIQGSYTYSGNTAAALAGVNNVSSASLTITWKTAGGSAKLVSTASTITFSQLNGGSAAGPVACADCSTDTYGLFQIGHDAAHGNTAAPSVTGDFAGTDSGATTTLDAMTSQSITALLEAGENLGGKGLKGASLGIGGMHVG